MWVLLHAKDYRQLTRLTVFVRAIMKTRGSGWFYLREGLS